MATELYLRFKLRSDTLDEEALKQKVKADMSLSYIPSLWKDITELKNAWVIKDHLLDQDIIGYENPSIEDASGWIRNLTKEGVEPNPGPSMSVTFDEIAATRFPDYKAAVRGDLAKIENEIKATVTAGGYGYTDEHVKKFFLGKSPEELAKIVGDDEKAATLDKEVREHLKLPTRAGGGSSSSGGTGTGVDSGFHPSKRARLDFAPPQFYFEDQSQFVITQTHKLLFGIPDELIGPVAAYKALLSVENKKDFIANFVDALQITTEQVSSPYKLPKLWWGEGIKHVASKLANNVQLLENEEGHCSNIVTGMKGVGKTKIVKYVAVLSALLSDNIISVYVDLSNVDLSPVEILCDAFIQAELIPPDTKLKGVEDVAGVIVPLKKRLLVAFDEAQKYYKLKSEESAITMSKARIRQLSELCDRKFCMVILCGSSSKLPILALRHCITHSAAELLALYPDYDSLNNHKFRPVPLNALRCDEMTSVMEYLMVSMAEQEVLALWTITGGSIRYIRRREELPTRTPLTGPEALILDHIVSLQPAEVDTDITKLFTVPIDEIRNLVVRWQEEGVCNVDPGIVYDMVDSQTLSSFFGESGEINRVGFSHPAQYTQMVSLETLPNRLTRFEREMLQDPKTYGELLEMFVESDIARIHLQTFVLCVENKASNVKEHHVDILLKDWRPLGAHKDIKVFKIYPDAFGVDVLKIVNHKPEKHPTASKQTATVSIQKHQFKLGGSRMSPGDANVKDTAYHAVHQAAKSDAIDNAVQTAFKATSIESEMIFIVTRVISDSVREIFTDGNNILWDHHYMQDHIWSPKVLQYANDVGLEWIIRK